MKIVDSKGLYPSLEELLGRAPEPGLEFALVPPSRLGFYQQFGWETVSGTPVIELEGSSGKSEAVLVRRGSPIVGASPANGVRRYFVDETLDTDLFDKPASRAGAKGGTG